MGKSAMERDWDIRARQDATQYVAGQYRLASSVLLLTTFLRLGPLSFA